MKTYVDQFFTGDELSDIADLAGCTVADVERICDWKHWSNRGEYSQADHESFLETAGIDDIAEWVKSVLTAGERQEK